MSSITGNLLFCVILLLCCIMEDDYVFTDLERIGYRIMKLLNDAAIILMAKPLIKCHW